MQQEDSEPHFRALVIEAVKIVGSQTELARLMSRSQQQVSALCTRADKISAEDALEIHWATDGKVPASKTRPDLWLRPDDVPTRERSQLEKIAS